MIKKYILLLYMVTLLAGMLQGQAKERGIIALEQMLNYPENEELKRQVVEDIKTVSSQPNFSVADYTQVKRAYDNLIRLHNRVYLAEIKLDLSHFKQLKRMGKNPKRQAKRYADTYERVLDNYDRRFVPLIDQLYARLLPVSGDRDFRREKDSLELEQLRLRGRGSRMQHHSATLGLLSSSFSLFSSITGAIARKKQENQKQVKEFIYEANKMFDAAQMPSWEALGVRPPMEYAQANPQPNQQVNNPGASSRTNTTGTGDNTRNSNNSDVSSNGRSGTSGTSSTSGSRVVSNTNNTSQGSSSAGRSSQTTSTYTSSNARESDMNQERDVPTDFAFLESISGNIYFEVYNERTGNDEPMMIRQGPISKVNVENYGNDKPSFDLVIGKKKPTRSKQISTTISPFETTNAYGAGTMYRVRATSTGYVYVFSINTGNKMFSIFPNQGSTEEIPAGTNYNYPDNIDFEDEESGKVSLSIPDGEYYIEISDPPGGARKPYETMIVLFSRSLLDMRHVFQKMEEMGGQKSPEERLAIIFGSLGATPQQARVNVRNGVLSYYLGEKDPAVVPIVFGIKRI